MSKNAGLIGLGAIGLGMDGYEALTPTLWSASC